MYPTVKVKGPTGLLVVILVFSEVHSFIFEDEGGTEFCSRTDNVHQNESTKKWLESSCDVERKIELCDRMISLRYNGIHREDLRRTPLLIREQRVPDENTRKSKITRGSVERYRTTPSRTSHESSENRRILEAARLIDNRGTRSESFRSARSLNTRKNKSVEIRSARSERRIIEATRLDENRATRLENIRSARSLNTGAERSVEIRSARSDSFRSRSIDNSASRSNENRFTRSTSSRYSRSGDRRKFPIENRTTRSVDNRASRINENRPMSDSTRISRSPENQESRSFKASRSNDNRLSESFDTRYTRSDINEANTSFGKGRSEFNGNRVTRSAETRIRPSENRSSRFGNNENTRERLKEVYSIRTNHIRSRSVASRLDENRAEHRGDKSIENRVERTLLMPAIKMDENYPTRSHHIRIVRSQGTQAIRSNEIRSVSWNNIRDSRSNEKLSTRSADILYIRPERRGFVRTSGNIADRFDEGRSTRSVLNRVEGFRGNNPVVFDDSRASRSIRADEIRATIARNTRVSRSMDYPSTSRSERSRLTRSIGNLFRGSYIDGAVRATNDRVTKEDRRHGTRSTEINRGTRSIENRLTRNYEMHTTPSIDIRSDRRVAKRSLVLSNTPDEKRNMYRRNEGALTEWLGDNSLRTESLFSIGSRRRSLNNRYQILLSRQPGDHKTERYSTENNRSGQNLIVVIDSRSRRNNLSNERPGRSSSSIRRSRGTNDMRVPRNYREFQRTEDEGRRRFSSISLKEEETLRVLQETKRNEFRIIGHLQKHDKDSRGFVREARRNSVVIRSEGSRFERIREFGNDKRQRQNYRMRLWGNTAENKATEAKERVRVIENVRTSPETRRSSISPFERTVEMHRYNENRRQHEFARKIRVDTRRINENAALSGLNMSVRRIVQGGRMTSSRVYTVAILKTRENMREVHAERNLVEIMKNAEAIDSIKSRRVVLEPRRAVSAVSRKSYYEIREINFMPGLRNSQPVKNTMKRSVRTIRNFSEDRELEEARKLERISPVSRRSISQRIDIDVHRNVGRETIIRKAKIANLDNRFFTGRESLPSLRKQTGHFRFGGARARFGKSVDEDHIVPEKAIFGLSSNGGLQLTLAAILVGQLIFSKLENSKINYSIVNWAREIRI